MDSNSCYGPGVTGGAHLASGMVMVDVDLTPSAVMASFVLNLDLCEVAVNPLHLMGAI